MKSAFRKHRKSVPRVGGELTQINVTGAGEVDKESGYTLTHIHGYRTNEHEFICQTRVFGSHSRLAGARTDAGRD